MSVFKIEELEQRIAPDMAPGLRPSIRADKRGSLSERRGVTMMRKLLVVAVLALLVSVVVLGNSPVSAQITRWVNDDDPNGGGYAPPGTSCNDPGYSTIGAAVTVAVSGDTIMVCSGMYVENVVLNESLTLLGAQFGVDACGRMASESILTPSNPLVRTLELQTGSAFSIVDGFTFLGGTRAIESTTGPIDGLQLLNNRVQGFTGNGVFLNDNGINITVNQNEIDGSSKVGGGGLFHLDLDNFDGFWFTNNCVVNGQGTPPGSGTGFFVDGNRNVDAGTTGSLTPTTGARMPLFSGNFIDNNGTGVNLGRKAWGDGPINGNTFSNNLFDGLQGGPKSSTISQNTFDGNGRSGLALTGFGSTSTDAGARSNTITQNCFTGNGFLQAGEGIFFSASQAAGTISTNVAHQNNISGNAFGARYNGTTETINAEYNWWGSPTGPFNAVNNPGGTGDAVSNNIDAYPFLTSQAAGTPCTQSVGKVTGGGKIDPESDSILELATLLIQSGSNSGGKATFGFVVQFTSGAAAPTGNLTYDDHGADVHIKATSYDLLMIEDGTCGPNTHARFTGMADVNGTAEPLEVEVDDCGEPGSSTAGGADTFSIKTTSYMGSGVLIGGNIQIQPGS
jgi:hypothetical protein